MVLGFPASFQAPEKSLEMPGSSRKARCFSLLKIDYGWKISHKPGYATILSLNTSHLNKPGLETADPQKPKSSMEHGATEGDVKSATAW